METSYKNISLFFGAVLTVVFIGFFKTYFSLFPHFEGINGIKHVHALLFLSWFALLIIQPILIKNKKTEAHRLIGKGTYILVPLICIATYILAKAQYDRELTQFPKTVAVTNLTIFSLLQLSIFVLFYFFSLINKKNTPFHIRYMVVTSLVLMDPGLGRAFIIWGGMPFLEGILWNFILTDFILLALLVYDIVKGKPYKPYLIALIVLVLSHLIWYYLPTTVVWQTWCEKF
jgi:hypothetical protein